MKTAFLFPGQGAQTPGMGAELYDHTPIYRHTFDLCEAGAGLDLKAACFEGANMNDSETVQPAIFAHTVSLLSVIFDVGIKADIYAGLSLGEYSALCAAGVLDAAQGAALVRRRGAIMDSACPEGTGGMLSVIGFTVEQVEEAILGTQGVYVANHLSDMQTVVAGGIEQLTALKQKLDESGAKMTSMLAVRGPSHCPILSGAADTFLAELNKIKLDNMNGTVYSNALGAPYPENADIRALLCEQMRARVQWHGCVEHMLAGGVTRFVEIGPGNVLAKLLKRRAGKDAEVISVRDESTLNAYIDLCGGISK